MITDRRAIKLREMPTVKPFKGPSKARAFSPSERASIRILLVEPDAAEREGIRTALKSLGFSSVFSSSDLLGSLKAICDKEISHVVFSIHKQNCSPVGFVKDVLAKNSKLVLVPASSEKELSSMLEYLRIGARGFLVKPATAELLEQTLLSATRGEGLSQVILESSNRNEVISAVLAAGIDKLSSAAQQSTPDGISTSAGDVSMASLRNLMKVALASSDGGAVTFLESLYSSLIKISEVETKSSGKLLERVRRDKQ